MNKKSIQEERMKGYFIQATKEILKSEGLRCVSVRNIADQAGYSYATLYNYFKDVNDLIFECVKDFHDECVDFVQAETKKSRRGKTKIETTVKAYMKFFVQYPGIYELFFLERMSELGHQKDTSLLIYHSLDTLCESEWQYLKREENVGEESIQKMKELLRFSVAGLMLFYLNRRLPESYPEFLKSVDNQLANILGA